MQASAVADDGLTPYHAIKLALPKLNTAGSAALVIGLGGLGLLDGQVSGRAIIVPWSRVLYDARSAHHRCRYSNA